MFSRVPSFFSSCFTLLNSRKCKYLLVYFFAHFLPADGAGRGVHLSVQSLLHLPPRPGSRLLWPGCQTTTYFQGLRHLQHFLSTWFLRTLSTRSCTSPASWASSSTTKSSRSRLFKDSSPVCSCFCCQWVSNLSIKLIWTLVSST